MPRLSSAEALKQGLCTLCRTSPAPEGYRLCDECRAESIKAKELNVAAGICIICTKRLVTSAGTLGGLTRCDVCLRRAKKALDPLKRKKGGPKVWSPKT